MSYRIYPRLLRADRATRLTLHPAPDAPPLADGARYELALYPTETARRAEPRRLTLRAAQGALSFEHLFVGEQEHVLLLRPEAGEQQELRVYSLAEDLFARRPYKGDLHIHSNRSDGLEPPAHVAAAGRRIGLDFMAITDHRRYEPSREAIAAFRALPIDLRLYPGEEVHPPEAIAHVVNFGGSFSLNARFGTASYAAEVAAIAARLGALPPDVDRAEYAALLWCFEKIREAGGLGIFCHPYWLSNHRYDIPEALTTRLLDEQPWDALEVVGGYHWHEVESNALQVARYQDERARGKLIPIVGVSDAHGCEDGKLFGWYYTIAFAPSASLPDLITSVKDLWAVAVESLPGDRARPYGPFRLVKYALFLQREVFPEHDRLAAEEARWMFAHLAGDARAATELAGLRGQVERLYARLWGQA